MNSDIRRAILEADSGSEAEARYQETMRALAKPVDLAIPPRFASATFESFEERTERQAELKRYVLRWTEGLLDEDRGQNLVLAGPAGSGKTHLAIAALRAYTEQRKVSARFIDAKLLLGKLRSGINSPILRDEAEELMRRARDSRLVVLDDLASDDVNVTEYVRDVLGDIVRTRYNEMRPTIVTTNRTAAEFEEAVGAPVASRLTGDGAWVAMRIEEDARHAER